MTIKINTEAEQAIFISSDLALVTAISLFYPIASVIKDNPRKAQFIFDRNKDLDKLLQKYWNKDLLVEPRQYFDQLKAIKNRIYSNE